MIIVTEVAEKEFIAQRLSSKGAVLALNGKRQDYKFWKDVKKVHPKAGNIGWGLTTWSEK